MSGLGELLRTQKLIVTSGSGGVGKTTVAAALGLKAAMSGRRTVVLTVDPAQRLATALGLESFSGQLCEVDRELCDRGGVSLTAPLFAMMLDVKSSSDAIVDRFAASPEAAQRIFDNPYYQALSNALPGTLEYVAVEQVRSLTRDGAYDLVVLDTPPAAHALDFLDAPERLLHVLDNRMLSWLSRPARSANGSTGAGLLGRGSRLIMRSLNKFTGGQFFTDLAEFLLAFGGLFEGFLAASRSVQQLLRESTTSFLLVTASNPSTVREARAFLGQLQSRSLPFGGLVCNRVHQRYAVPQATCEETARALAQALPTDSGASHGALTSLAMRMQIGLSDHNRMSQRDLKAVRRLSEITHAEPAVIPLFPGDVHNLRALNRMGDHLLGRVRTVAMTRDYQPPASDASPGSAVGSVSERSWK